MNLDHGSAPYASMGSMVPKKSTFDAPSSSKLDLYHTTYSTLHKPADPALHQALNRSTIDASIPFPTQSTRTINQTGRPEAYQAGSAHNTTQTAETIHQRSQSMVVNRSSYQSDNQSTYFQSFKRYPEPSIPSADKINHSINSIKQTFASPIVTSDGYLNDEPRHRASGFTSNEKHGFNKPHPTGHSYYQTMFQDQADKQWNNSSTKQALKQFRPHTAPALNGYTRNNASLDLSQGQPATNESTYHAAHQRPATSYGKSLTQPFDSTRHELFWRTQEKQFVNGFTKSRAQPPCEGVGTEDTKLLLSYNKLSKQTKQTSSTQPTSSSDVYKFKYTQRQPASYDASLHQTKNSLITQANGYLRNGPRIVPNSIARYHEYSV